ncbi:MAG: murein transglycosylase domain-containing protein [Bacteroidales bacterium]|jgi:membrane-bound lytic murein transglycosylase C|nr:murein transglycosylase domain-containing protein [Bacteroidales bacterium]
MMQKYFLLILVFSCFHLYSQTEQQISDFQKAQQREIERMSNEREQFIIDSEKEFEEYLKAEQEAYDEFIKSISKIWGNENVIVSTNKDWVEYTDDKKGRSVVDFEKGEARVEIVLTEEEAKDIEKIQEKVEEQVVDLLTTQGTTKDYDTEFEKREPLSDEAVLVGQVILPTEDNKTEKNTSDLPEKKLETDVKQLVETGDVKIEIVRGDDGVERKVASFTLNLAPDHIKTRAEKFTDDIKYFSKKYNLCPALVCAIIHTESYFNPKAKSHAAAYGLMQLVPKYGGRAAYKYVYGKDKTPTALYLYNPKNNIELGTAYMNMLVTQSFNKITCDDCRTLCAVAAYNTGAGNVSKAFTGNTKISSAIPLINNYEYNDLYDHMSKKLPYKETRDYIKKVTERRAQYQEWGWEI